MKERLSMDDQAKRPSRLWKIILVCSLALNLAIVGIIGGSLASGRLGDGPPRSFDLGLGPVARALDPQERREIGRSLRQDRELRDVNLRGRVSGMVDALKADPFDPEIVRGLMSEQIARMADVQGRAQDAFIIVITEMSPERRAAFADQLASELSRERRPKDRRSGG
jgi:uncharacterized membrane protein